MKECIFCIFFGQYYHKDAQYDWGCALKGLGRHFYFIWT